MNWERLLVCGGIGSGKSVVLGLFAAAGYQTVDADSEGYRVLLSDGPAFGEVAARWPEVVVDGEVDRSALARIVFSDEAELETLESLTHPHIFGRIMERVEEIGGPAAVEMPVITDRLGESWSRLVVDSSQDDRLGRAVGRGMAPADVRNRMQSQPTRSEWLAAADVVVPNHGSLQELERTTAALLGSIPSMR